MSLSRRKRSCAPNSDGYHSSMNPSIRKRPERPLRTWGSAWPCVRVIPERTLPRDPRARATVVEFEVVAHWHLAVRMASRDRILDHLERGDRDVDIVCRWIRRDAHAVVVEIRRLGSVDLDVGGTDAIDEPQAKLLAATQAKERWTVLAVVDVGDERLLCDGHDTRQYGIRLGAAPSVNSTTPRLALITVGSTSGGPSVSPWPPNAANPIASKNRTASPVPAVVLHLANDICIMT